MSKLQAISLEKQYKRRKVVKDVNIHISNNEIVGLLGPNGAGKTTSFYMIVGLITCDSGKVMVDETDITHLPMHLRARMGIGYLPQESSIFRKLTVSQNIMAILQLRKSLKKSQRLELMENLMQEFHIAHLRDNYGYTLSGGERRRVEIARALAMEPRFILLDEPFAGIDPISVIDIKRIILHLRDRGIGVLITDHNVRETLDICQRAYIVSEGGIIAEGSAEVILSNKKVREVYLGHEFDL
ncbi:MAG TPA: LPS export ABC transporter ATP-binding protein [Gammaproteobacteria bacterium]|nr:LPS export ABC transporter ATP-binding protein [Gammaproteobacteria bacterium]